ncbi:MAG: YigZ family protein [Brooklawnia sp.]|uniref:IMPACT family protein n=1 Tax=Brooklawnia sp. TaxID=2699740 RepID=UPI003C75D9FE
MSQAQANHYVVLRRTARPSVEIEIKRSRFIGYAARVETEEEARSFLADLRQQHRTARHVCHAFVLGPDRDTQRSSDDGEPSGTAGAPILNAITGRQTSPGVTELSDVVVAVVRYFGGVKLGAGGLVQAYSDTAAATLDAARMVVRQRMQELTLPLPIPEAGRIETTLRSRGVHVEPTSYRADHADLTLAVPDEPATIEAMVDQLAELSGGRAAPGLGAVRWLDEA